MMLMIAPVAREAFHLPLVNRVRSFGLCGLDQARLRCDGYLLLSSTESELRTELRLLAHCHYQVVLLKDTESRSRIHAHLVGPGRHQDDRVSPVFSGGRRSHRAGTFAGQGYFGLIDAAPLWIRNDT